MPEPAIRATPEAFGRLLELLHGAPPAPEPSRWRHPLRWLRWRRRRPYHHVLGRLEIGEAAAANRERQAQPDA